LVTEISSACPNSRPALDPRKITKLAGNRIFTGLWLAGFAGEERRKQLGPELLPVFHITFIPFKNKFTKSPVFSSHACGRL
jgi:hypothetical protein